MKTLAIFIATFIICESVSDFYNEGRVTGGHGSQLGDFPWQAVIHHKDTYRCLGVIITERIILTINDATCVTEAEVDAGEVYIHLGVLVAANISSRYKIQTYLPADPAGPLIGLETKEMISITKDIRAIKVLMTEIHDYTAAQSSGWGFDNQRIFNYLQYVDLNITYSDVSLSITSEDLQPKHACKWDRGTGLVITDKNTLLRLLVGIAATNEAVCEPVPGNPPSITEYIPISNNLDFINELLDRR